MLFLILLAGVPKPDPPHGHPQQAYPSIQHGQQHVGGDLHLHRLTFPHLIALGKLAIHQSTKFVTATGQNQAMYWEPEDSGPLWTIWIHLGFGKQISLIKQSSIINQTFSKYKGDVQPMLRLILEIQLPTTHAVLATRCRRR